MHPGIIIASLAGLAFGSWRDLKTREVPDWINYALMTFGILGSAMLSIIKQDPSIIIYSLSGFLICVLIGLLMYYAGQWGGGDSKLIMGIGALNGFNWQNISLFNIPFLIQFLVNLIVVGAAYGIIYTIVLAIKHWNIFHKSFAREANRQKELRISAIIIGIMGVTYSFVFNGPKMIFFLAVGMFFMFYLWIMVRVVERECMIKQVKPEVLTEGDWIYKDVIVKGKRLAGPKDLGITLAQIKEIKKHKVKLVWLREGIPFVPSFLFAYLISIIFPMWFLFW